MRFIMRILLSDKEGAVCTRPDEICDQCQTIYTYTLILLQFIAGQAPMRVFRANCKTDYSWVPVTCPIY